MHIVVYVHLLIPSPYMSNSYLIYISYTNFTNIHMYIYMYDITHRKVENDSISSSSDCKFVIKKESDDIMTILQAM